MPDVKMINSSHQLTQFSLRESVLMKQVNSILHLMAITACWLAAIPESVQLCLICMILVSAWFHRNYPEPASIELKYTLNREWEVSLDGNHFFRAVILESTWITPVVIFLHLTSVEHGNLTRLVARDSLSADEYRRLKVKLKLSGVRINDR